MPSRWLPPTWSPDNSYSLRVTTDNANTGFDSGCTDRQDDLTITLGDTSHTASLTLHGCTAPGGIVTATLLQGTATVATATAEITVTTSSNVSLTLSPRVVGSTTYTNMAMEWTDPESCDGEYLVGLFNGDSVITFLGFHPAPETTSPKRRAQHTLG